MQLGTVSGHEDPAIPVTSVQDNGPTQSSLRGFEHAVTLARLGGLPERAALAMESEITRRKGKLEANNDLMRVEQA
jgi:hypothetical protein